MDPRSALSNVSTGTSSAVQSLFFAHEQLSVLASHFQQQGHQGHVIGLVQRSSSQDAKI